MGQTRFCTKKTDFPDWVATDPESGGGTQNLVPGTQIVVYILAVTAVTQLVLLFACTVISIIMPPPHFYRKYAPPFSEGSFLKILWWEMPG